jgi:hypothetical protein
MEKRAQVTLFIILAILIVGAITSFFVFRDRLFDVDESVVPKDLESFTLGIQYCVEEVLQDGSRLVGLQGGYIIPPEGSLETNFSYISYGYHLGRDFLPSKEKMEREIANYIELTLPFCVDQDSSNYLITMEDVQAKVKIQDNFIEAKVKYPFIASKDKTSLRINKEYYAVSDFRLGDIYKVSKNIVDSLIQDPSMLDFSYLNRFDYDISILFEGNNIIVYSINDYDLERGSYTFRFANRIK